MVFALSKLIVGIVQAEYKTSLTENLEKTTQFIKKHYREANMIVLPEYSMFNPLLVRDSRRVYEAAEYLIGSKYLSELAKLATSIGTNIVAHFIEKTERPPLSKSTTVLVTSDGDIVPVYSKMHLFDAYGYKESDFFERGKAPSKIVSIGGFEVAFAICYDIRFPELFRTYAWLGAKVVVVQAGWVKGPLKEEVLDTLASARAHENTIYVVVANQTGEMFTGRSGVFNPWGYKELDLGVAEVYSEHELRMSEVESARAAIPVLSQSSGTWVIRLKEQ